MCYKKDKQIMRPHIDKMTKYWHNSINLVSTNYFFPNYLVSIRKVFLSGCWNYWFSLRKRGIFFLARKSINYEEAYLNSLTNNCAD